MTFTRLHTKRFLTVCYGIKILHYIQVWWKINNLPLIYNLDAATGIKSYLRHMKCNVNTPTHLTGIRRTTFLQLNIFIIACFNMSVFIQYNIRQLWKLYPKDKPKIFSITSPFINRGHKTYSKTLYMTIFPPNLESTRP